MLVVALLGTALRALRRTRAWVRRALRRNRTRRGRWHAAVVVALRRIALRRVWWTVRWIARLTLIRLIWRRIARVVSMLLVRATLRRVALVLRCHGRLLRRYTGTSRLPWNRRSLIGCSLPGR